MIDHFMSLLDKDPEDFTTRKVFADWCEENNMPERAQALRYMIKYRKRPKQWNDKLFLWFNNKYLGRTCDLPAGIFKRLTVYVRDSDAYKKEYSSARLAEEDFHQAYIRYKAKKP
jgi:uncharacterized protein (TIGR02996 family)